MKKFLFYDTTWNQILRVGNFVSKHMKENSDVYTYGLVFETSDKEIDISKDKHYFDEAYVSRDIKVINNRIREIKPDVVVFAQNTIPDLDAILYARKNGAQIVMLQHGLLYDGASLNNVRANEIFAALLKAKKTSAYLNILGTMCREEHKSFVKAIIKIISEKYNVTTTIQNMFNPPLRGDVAFVIGEHWSEYYHDNYGYEKKDIYIMGNHDVDDLKQEYELEDAICYIPSVHVEDGKVMQHVFDSFLNNLAASIPEGVKLYIKFHPRSNKDLYLKAFENVNVEYISGNDFPYVRTYIGHNSSLLSKALQISGVVILWGFKEEPELFYKDFAYVVCDDEASLKKAIEYVSEHKEYSKKAEIDRYSYQNPIGAYKYCALKVLELFN